MNDVNFGDLVGRMALSLVVVLGLVFGAYWLIKRRQNPCVSSGSRNGGPRRAMLAKVLVPGHAAGSSGARGASSAKRGLKIVGRVGLSRTSSVVAVQFAERVFMLGSSEQGPPTVLAELDLDAWTSATESGEELVPMLRPGGPTSPLAGRPRPTLIESMRKATARRV